MLFRSVIMPVSGYVYSCAGGYGLPWFGLFTWPRLLARDEALSHAGYLIHHYVGWALWALLAVHVAAVVWHRLRRDEVLGRML